MAAGNFVFYGAFFENLAKGIIDLDGHTIKAMLMGSGYTPDDDTDAVVADISANEVNAGTFPDYARVTLTTVSVTRTGMVTTFTSDPADFGATVDITAAYIVLYDDTPTSPADPLIGYADLNTGGATVSSVDGPFEVSPHATNGWGTFGPPA